MYRTIIETAPDGKLTVAVEYSTNPEITPYLLVDCCREMECSHARRILARAKLEPVSACGLTFFLSEEL